MLALVVALALTPSLAAAPPTRKASAKPGGEKEGATGAELAASMKSGMQEEAVMGVTNSGNIVLFSGAITVPADRPSVEQCGEWISTDPSARPRLLGEKRAAAERLANDNRYDAREKQNYVSKALAPFRTCEADFKRRCEEIRAQVGLEVRKRAVASAKKAIANLTNDARKNSATASLTNLLAACPFES